MILTLNSGRESNEDAELHARRSGGNGYRPYRADNGRSDPFHSGSVHRPPTRHGPTSFGYNDSEEGRLHSNRESRDGGRRVQPFDSRGPGRLEERDNRSAEWWAEEDRRGRPNHTLLGYWTQLDDPEAAPVFVANPTLDSSYASSIERQRSLIGGR